MRTHIVLGPAASTILGGSSSDQRVTAPMRRISLNGVGSTSPLQHQVIKNVVSVKITKVLIANMEKDGEFLHQTGVVESPIENLLHLRVLHQGQPLPSPTIMAPSASVNLAPATNPFEYGLYTTTARVASTDDPNPSDYYRFTYTQNLDQLKHICACVNMHAGDKYAINDSGDMLETITFDRPVTLTTQLEVEVVPLFTLEKYKNTSKGPAEPNKFEHSYKLLSCMLEVEHMGGHQQGTHIQI